MRNQKALLAALFALTLQAALASCQQLTIRAENGKPTVLSRADIEALPRAKITTTASGPRMPFEGPSLKAVLEPSGVGFRQTWTASLLAPPLLVEAAHAYR